MAAKEEAKAFTDAKTEYEKQREVQRLKLRDFLSEHERLKAAGLKVVTAGASGKGSKKYRGNYDLTNWKWVEVKSADGFDCVISLNMLDIDPRTQNVHSLYDRIGLILTLEKWLCTDIDLPLVGDEKDDQDKQERIAELVLEQYKKFEKEKRKKG